MSPFNNSDEKIICHDDLRNNNMASHVLLLDRTVFPIRTILKEKYISKTVRLSW